jgi:hypothetical protein
MTVSKLREGKKILPTDDLEKVATPISEYGRGTQIPEGTEQPLNVNNGNNSGAAQPRNPAPSSNTVQNNTEKTPKGTYTHAYHQKCCVSKHKPLDTQKYYNTFYNQFATLIMIVSQ